MELSARPVKNPSVLARRIVDEEMVLVNGDNAAALALTNPTAVFIWEAVDGKTSVRGIIDGVNQRFQGVPDTVADDVRGLLEQLAVDGFIGFEVTDRP